ncbi:glycosyltransferase family 2 protein [Pseudoalteromonas apostichopi]|uniref:glycosyltransferase family 2 protein n=1 Tax=Pseudoalteromonas apostichopi TaxID=3035452 RepID=UPI0025734E24|nr:glycosyltransferase family 2 protein [Pseudoalteromonas sp. FE4]
MPLVSIITPVYNAKKFIKKTIDSVVSQTFSDWEYVLVDDCSTDNSFEFIKEQYKEDKRVRVIQLEKNGGAGVARNAGLVEAKGEVIAFLDADDLWEPDKLEKQIKYMKDGSFPIVHTSYSFIDEDDRAISGRVNVSEVVNLNSYMRNTEIGMSTAIIDKTIVGEFYLDTIRTRQDTKLWLTLLSRGFTAHGLDLPLVKYRIRKGQISGNKFVIAFRTLKVFWSVKTLSPILRLCNFIFYSFNSVRKRTMK